MWSSCQFIIENPKNGANSDHKYITRYNKLHMMNNYEWLRSDDGLLRKWEGKKMTGLLLCKKSKGSTLRLASKSIHISKMSWRYQCPALFGVPLHLRAWIILSMLRIPRHVRGAVVVHRWSVKAREIRWVTSNHLLIRLGYINQVAPHSAVNAYSNISGNTSSRT